MTRPATREEKIVRPGVYEVPEFNCPRCGHCCSQRQWVGLTEEEHTQIAVDAGCMSSDWVFYGAAVERALKEKNK